MRGKYYRSLKAYALATGKTENQAKSYLENRPSIDRTGSVYGMRKLFWGNACDVVRWGNYIYKA